eukprot:CAMPEP_0185745118 /NCGR_PEP_ID=MMETSP1174-20130828/3393_1 /TAXON_ID=35687 /ORGANISM="Dictyocha speculum, Strain CCMP1381" /LENGTH=581 /DNA_ID=CAMNT_0028418917 /DNA_START=40 /DNA_END=1785 /DNA_ORIENTATION=-
MSAVRVKTLKISFEGEVRRIPLLFPVGPGEYAIEDLEMLIPKIFINTLKKTNFRITYIDDEDDIITISTQPELNEAVGLAITMGRHVMRFDIIRANKEKNKAGGGKFSGGGESHTLTNVTHLHVSCDGCNTTPIIGARFKCTFRPDYDLCERCEAQDTSPYPYTKIKTPIQCELWTKGDDYRCSSGYTQDTGENALNTDEARLRSNKTVVQSQCDDNVTEFKASLHEKATSFTVKSLNNEDITAAAEEEKQSLVESGDVILEEILFVDEKFAAAIQEEQQMLTQETNNGPIINNPPPPPQTFERVVSGNTCDQVQPVILDAKFVADMTVPDGTSFEPKAPFLKTWRLRNDGDVALPESRLMPLNATDSCCLSGPMEGVLIAAKQPLQEFDVTVPFVAPLLPGHFVSEWRLMRTDTGTFFGDRLWVEVKVQDEWAMVVDSSRKEDSKDSKTALETTAEETNPQELVVLQPRDSRRETAAAAVEEAVASEGGERLAQEAGEEYSSMNPFLQDCAGVGEATSHDNTQRDSSPGDTTDKWAEALMVLYGMGFEDHDAMVSALQDHATPDTWQQEQKMQEIISALL